ncbi:MAG: SGNH/GDSL hydrolase family protein [Variovorax sp.]|nr:SGNH/GDSL hydrolase family protein [Variovorax sp.]
MKKTLSLAATLFLVACGAVPGCNTDIGDGPPSAAASRPAQPIDCSVVLYGDSIMHGGYVDGTETKRHARHLSAELKAQRPAWTVDDRTVSGQSLAKMSKIFYKETRSARVVVLGSGIAEAWSGGDVKAQLAQLVHDVRDEGRVPILTGYARQVPNGFMTPERLAGRDRADADVAALADELDVTFADFGAAGPVEIIDDVHPTQAYSLRITEQLIRALDKAAPECNNAALAQ